MLHSKNKSDTIIMNDPDEKENYRFLKTNCGCRDSLCSMMSSDLKRSIKKDRRFIEYARANKASQMNNIRMATMQIGVN